MPNTQVNRIILGGEKLDPNTIFRIRDAYHDKNNVDLIIYDEYGPTEATVGTSNNQVYPNLNFTIGKPYYNYKVYVLDVNLNNIRGLILPGFILLLFFFKAINNTIYKWHKLNH